MWVTELVIIICISFAMSYYLKNSIRESQRVLAARRNILTLIDNCLISLLNAETGVRGFAITNDEEYLEPYKIGLSDYYVNIKKLIEATKEDPIQSKYALEIKKIAEEKIHFMESKEKVVAAKKPNSIETVRNMMETYKNGKKIMDETRSIMYNMRKQEEKEVATYYFILAKKVDNIVYIVFSLIVVNFIVLVITSLLIKELKTQSGNY